MGGVGWRALVVAAALMAGLGWLAPPQARAYVLGARPWPAGVIRYYNSDPAMRSEVAAATSAWNHSGAHVHFVAVPPSQAQVVIDGWPKGLAPGGEAGFATLGYVPPGGQAIDPLGHLIRGSHVWLRPVNVAAGLNPAIMTLATTHELGHVLGLAHSGTCATMDAVLLADCKPAPHDWEFDCRLLQPDDVAGGVALYGGHARPVGPNRYCSYVPVPGPPSAVTASVLPLSGGYGLRSVRLSLRVPRGVRFNASPTGNSIGYIQVYGAAGRCRTKEIDDLTTVSAKPGAINRTTVSPTSPGRWCFTVQILDIFQRPSRSVTVWATVPGPPPVADFDFAQDATNGLLVHIHDDASSSAGALTYAWSFGDPNSGAANASSQASPSHTFSAPGSYQVTETVTDAFGQRDHSTQTVTVAPYAPPTAAFDDDCPSDGTCSLGGASAYTVGFYDQSSSPDGTVISWSWNFGDPTSATNTDSGSSPLHDYSVPGTYTVTLTVTDDHGQRATTSQSVYIDP